MKMQVAAAWYQRGEKERQAGDIRTAITSFHRATVNNRENFQYAMSMAVTLAAAGQTQEARLALVRLRDSAPENAQINLELARLTARQGDVPEAVRYYRHALYGVWPDLQADQHRREARIELVRFLLDHQERSTALSELLLLIREIPPGSASYTQVARLLLEAGEAQRALDHFTQAIRLDGKNAAAFAGAGEAALQLREYSRARGYFEAALLRHPDLERTRALLEITRLVLSNDPMGPRLPTGERHRRLLANWGYSLQRLQHCLEQQSQSEVSTRPDLEALSAEAKTVQPKLQLRNLRRDPDLLTTGMELLSRIEEATARACPDTTALDQALLLISRKFGGTEQ